MSTSLTETDHSKQRRKKKRAKRKTQKLPVMEDVKGKSKIDLIRILKDKKTEEKNKQTQSPDEKQVLERARGTEP